MHNSMLTISSDLLPWKYSCSLIQGTPWTCFHYSQLELSMKWRFGICASQQIEPIQLIVKTKLDNNNCDSHKTNSFRMQNPSQASLCAIHPSKNTRTTFTRVCCSFALQFWREDDSLKLWINTVMSWTFHF